MKNIDELRPMTAWQLLEIWQKCRAEIRDPLERVMTCNARILARCCFFQGETVYQDGIEALRDLTARQIERLLDQLYQGGGKRAGEENPQFDPARFAALREK